MNTGFDKLQFWQPDKLLGLAQKYRTVFIRRVTEEGKDYKGRPFKNYSKGYSKLLGKDFRKLDGSRYKGFEGMSLATSGAKVSRRQFRLRGITMFSGFKVNKAVTDGFTLTWDGEAGAIVEGNARKGRNIIDDIPDREKDYLLRELGKLVDKEFNKIPDIINLGR